MSTFSLTVPALSNLLDKTGEFRVLSFESLVKTRWHTHNNIYHGFEYANRCGQHGLSEHYAFGLEIQTTVSVKPSQLLEQIALLTCGDSVFHGYLSTIVCLPTTPDGHRYRLTLSSPLHPLTQKPRSRVFIDKTVPEIIDACLSQYGWQRGQHGLYDFALTKHYPKVACWIQQNENDLAHLERLLRRYGIFFYFMQTKDRHQLLLTDTFGKRIPVSLSFTQADQSLFEVSTSSQVLPNATVYSEYNPASPKDAWVMRKQAKKMAGLSKQGRGIHSQGLGFSSEQEGILLAKVRQDSIDWQRLVTVASTTMMGLQPGDAIAICDHPVLALNQTYIIVDIEHRGNDSATQLGDRPKHNRPSSNRCYTARLLLIPEDISFKKYDGYPPLLQPPIRGKLESIDTSSDAGAVDQTGHYRFRYPFDTSDRNPIGMASPSTRFTQLMGTAGNGLAGMHFPNRQGTEVEIGFLHGNIHCPIILGALASPAVVNEKNHQQALVRTAGGHEWCLNDTPEQASIHLATPDKTEMLKLNANTDNPGITLKTETGSIHMHAGHDIRWKTAHTLSIQATGYESILQDAYSLVAKQHIDWQTSGHFFVKATFMQFKASELLVSANQHIVLETKSLRCSGESGKSNQVTLTANQAVDIRAKTITFNARDTLTLQNAGAKIVFKNGNIHIKSPTEIVLTGKSVVFIGAQRRG